MKEQNTQKDWWNKKEGEGFLHYIEYKVKNTTVMVGVRPNCYGVDTKTYDSIDAFMNVSDRFVRHRKDKLNVFNPWNESGGKPTIELIWATLKTLHYWIDDLELDRIYIHCDGGTHRAVSTFGFYLLAYHEEDSSEIEKNHKIVNRENFSSPLHYAGSYINREKIPLFEKLIKKMKDSHDDYSHGQELADFLSKNYTDKELKEYHAKMFYTFYSKQAFYQIKEIIKHYGWYVLFQRPKRRLHINFHKFFNTKKGKVYKKLKF